jgi:hypothetical protein
MNITPTEVYITYPVTMSLSMFREAELAARHDRKTLNEYILEGIRSDLESFPDSDGEVPEDQ